MDRLSTSYLTLLRRNVDFSVTGKYNQLREMSDLQTMMTYFGLDNTMFSLRYY